MSELAIRAVSGPEELRACEDLQVEVWGYSEREVVPKNELLAAVRSGGSLLGAFEGATLVGFAYGMAGWDGAEAYLSSRLLAVRESSRSRGLGERLKLAQRDDARRIGYAKIRWTQDPLQAANARLNFAKLGATARSYKLDYYGSTSSPLHGSLPTDRLELEWDLSKDTTATSGALPRLTGSEVLLLDRSDDERPRPIPRELAADAKALLVRIPRAFPALLAADKELALAWRLATRRAFQEAFAAGFAITGFDDGYRLSRLTP